MRATLHTQMRLDRLARAEILRDFEGSADQRDCPRCVTAVAGQRAGVSHAAPYAHFTDKQALIAAISTEGYRRLYEKLTAAGAKISG